MERDMRPRIVFIGAGNVAWHLAKAYDKVCDIVQIYSRTQSKALELATELKNANATSSIENIVNDADIYIVSIKDDAIAKLIESINIRNGLWIHTSGCVAIDVFNGKRDKYGVLYPLQTFTRSVSPTIDDIPFFIEGNNEETINEIKQLAHLISKNVQIANSANRRIIHVAAVFASNFTNHLWVQANDILSKAGYDFDVLLPLIKATLAKTEQIAPIDGQTGPARRGDTEIMAKHLSLLDKNQAMLYKMLSQSIMNRYNIPTNNE